MQLCFATTNAYKLAEIQALSVGWLQVGGLGDIGCDEALAEDQNTLEGNSLQKAQYVHERYKINCFADDTGLEVNELDRAPGVHSARYAGNQRSNQDNMALVMQKLESKADRSAQFRTVITLIIEGKQKQFEGIVRGEIIKQQRGTEGFGYDPIFIPQGYDQTFAEMSRTEKNKISHRGISFEKLIVYLKANAGSVDS